MPISLRIQHEIYTYLRNKIILILCQIFQHIDFILANCLQNLTNTLTKLKVLLGLKQEKKLKG